MTERKRTKWLFFFLILLLNYPSSTKAEEIQVHQVRASTGQRKISETRLSDDMLNLISTGFGLPLAYIQRQFEPSLPLAIEKVKTNNNEESISEIIAFLMGRTNTVQRDRLMQEVSTAIQQETQERDPEKKDERKLILLKRIKWALLERKGTPSNLEEAQAFNSKFSAEYEKVIAKNNEIFEKLAQATAVPPNAQAKQWLRDNLSKEALTGFLEAQRESGNKDISDDFLVGLSFNTGDEKFVDFNAPDGQPQRLYIGSTRESASNAIEGHAAANRQAGRSALGGALVATREHPQVPEQRWYMNEQNQYTRGTPPGIVPARNVARTSSEPRRNQVTNDDREKFQILKQFVETTGRCGSCHNRVTVTGTSLADARLQRGRNTYDLQQFHTATGEIAEMSAVLDQSLPNGSPFRDGLARWVQRQQELASQ